MDLMKMFNQAINVILKPKEALKKAQTEQVATIDIIIYLAIIGIPTLLGFIIGYGVIWWGSGGELLGASVGAAIAYYIVAIIGIMAFGFIFNAFAPTFKSQQNQMQAFKLVAYAATPWLLAGILYIIPTIWFLVPLAGLYGLYILYIGIPIFMGTPQDQHIPYLLVSIVIYAVIMFVVWYIAEQIMWRLIYGSTWYGYGWRF
jgi:hypothetical protein